MRKERVANALSHKESDKTPHHVELTSGLLARVAEHVQIDPAEFDNWADNHCAKISYNIGGSDLGNGRYRDEFGVVWDRSGEGQDVGMLEAIMLPEPELGGYTFPKPDLDAVREKTERALETTDDRFVFGKIGTTYFERAWSLTGMENMLVWLALEPEFVDSLFQRILEYNLAIIDVALEYEIDGFYFGDDYGQQTGLLMSPDMWRQFIKPGLMEMFSRIKSKGKVVALHSCGNIAALFPELIEMGLDAYQTFQPEVYDVTEIKRTYGNALTFWGGISTQQALPFSTPQEVRRATKEMLGTMGPGGGYIAGPTHRIPPDVPVQNVVALVETLQNQ